MEKHPYCDACPRMTPREMADLVKSMRTNGYLSDEPIWIYQGKILDGASRFDAAKKANVRYTTKIFEGDDEAASQFVIAKNIARRHLNQGQKALIAQKLATARQGGQHGNMNQSSNTYPIGVGIKEKKNDINTIASAMGISPKTIDAARVVSKRAAPQITAMVQSGDIGLPSAVLAIRREPDKEKQAKLSKDQIIALAREQRAIETRNRAAKITQYVRDGAKAAGITITMEHGIVPGGWRALPENYKEEFKKLQTGLYRTIIRINNLCKFASQIEPETRWKWDQQLSTAINELKHCVKQIKDAGELVEPPCAIPVRLHKS